MSPGELRTKNDCGGEDQQRFTLPDNQHVILNTHLLFFSNSVPQLSIEHFYNKFLLKISYLNKIQQVMSIQKHRYIPEVLLYPQLNSEVNNITTDQSNL
jgi:hypothetical protein